MAEPPAYRRGNAEVRLVISLQTSTPYFTKEFASVLCNLDIRPQEIIHGENKNFLHDTLCYYIVLVWKGGSGPELRNMLENKKSAIEAALDDEVTFPKRQAVITIDHGHKVKVPEGEEVEDCELDVLAQALVDGFTSESPSTLKYHSCST